MNIRLVRTCRSSLKSELTTLSNYLSSGDKARMISIIEKVNEEIMKRDEALLQLDNRSSRLSSAILSLPQKPDSKDKNKLYNRLSDFLLITQWHILREEGKDVSDEPWVLEEEEKEAEEEEKEVPTNEIPEEMLRDIN